MPTLKELVQSYEALVSDATRVMQRLKALYRGRAIPVKGRAVYRKDERKAWLDKLQGGARVRAAALFRQLDLLLELGGPAKGAMVTEARRQPGWKVLRSIPYLGEVRVAELLATLKTSHRRRLTDERSAARSSADVHFAVEPGSSERRRVRMSPNRRTRNVQGIGSRMSYARIVPGAAPYTMPMPTPILLASSRPRASGMAIEGEGMRTLCPTRGSQPLPWSPP